MRKKLLSALLVLAMVLSLVPVTALADESVDYKANGRVVAVADGKGQSNEIASAMLVNDTVEVKVNVQDNPPSVSGDGTGDSNVLAYWVGVGIVVPSTEYTKVAFKGGSSPNAFKDNGPLDEFWVGSEVKEGFTIWIDASNEEFKNTGITYELQWKKSDENNPMRETYHVQLNNVVSDPKVTSIVDVAPLSSRDMVKGDYEIKKTGDDDDYTTLTLTAKDVVRHAKGGGEITEANGGYWVGVGFVPLVPAEKEAPEKVRYKTADSRDKLGTQYKTLDVLEPDVNGEEDGIAFYVDAKNYVNSNDSLWIGIQWVDGTDTPVGMEETYEIKFNVSLFEETTATPSVTIQSFGFKAKAADANGAINTAIGSISGTQGSVGDSVGNTMYAVFTATPGKYNVAFKDSNGSGVYNEAIEVGSGNKGGYVYFSFDDQASGKLTADEYTVEISEEDSPSRKYTEKCAVYKVQFAAVNGTIADADKDGGFAMEEDAGITKPNVTADTGCELKSWQKTTEGYVITYTAQCEKKQDDNTGGGTGGDNTGGGTGGDNTGGGTGGDNTGGGTGGDNTGGGTGGDNTGGGTAPDDETVYTIQIASGIQHGRVYTDTMSAKKGTTVRVTAEPDSDYVVDYIRVTRDDTGTTISTGRTFTMPASDVTVTVTFTLRPEYNSFVPPQTQPQYQNQSQAQTGAPATLPTSVFKPVTWRPAAVLRDVPATSWAYPAAQWAYQNGYLDTAADGTFQLNDTVSNIQLWRIMARWQGEAYLDDNSVTQWARKTGAFRVGAASGAMTRQNMVEYLYQCYFLLGGDVSVTGNLIQYRDSQMIVSNSAKNAWIWAVNKGIISGTPDGALNPNGVLSRGEFASILMRLCQKG